MILVDTSVWVDHLRAGDAHLAGLLECGAVACHELVIGEIACGNLKKRREVLGALSLLPRCEPAAHDEVLFFIERHELMGRGIGYIDSCLLASATLSGARLWTRAKRLADIVVDLGCGYAR